MGCRTPPDMAKICRVCMRSDRALCHIFDEQHAEDDHINLAQLLTQCSQYEVREDDELPQQLCNVCMTDARIALRFKRECEASYRKLSLLLGRHVSEQFDSKQNSELNNYKVRKEHVDRVECGTQTEQNEICEAALRKQTRGRGKQKQCPVCHRQFSRRDHMSRHLAVMHKIIVTPAYSSDDEQTLETDDQEDFKPLPDILGGGGGIGIESPATPKDELEFIFETAEIEVDELTTCDEFAQHGYDFVEQENNDDDLLLKDEDEQPLATLIEEPKQSKSFMKVLLNEARPKDISGYDDSQTSLASTVQKAATTPATQIKRKRGRPPRVKSNQSKSAQSSEQNANVENMLTNNELEHASVAQVEQVLDIEASPIALETDGDADAGASKSHQCKICQKCFTTNIYLRRHMAIHERKRYVCKECSKCYMTKDELAQHVKAEGHDKPMLCPECGLRCKTSNNLTVHMRRHKGEKPFKCKFCSKGFPRVDDLRVHEKYHTGEKSHFCETCGKGFQRKYNLTIHLRVHTGERPYKCPHCPQAFAQGNDLKAHIRRHTGERFRCEICDAAFLQIYQIRHHKLLQHGIKEEPPTQRVAKFTSREAQEQQIKRNLQQELTAMDSTAANPEIEAINTELATLDQQTDSFVMC